MDYITGKVNLDGGFLYLTWYVIEVFTMLY